MGEIGLFANDEKGLRVALISSLGQKSRKDARDGDHFHLVFAKTDSDKEDGQS